MTTSVTSLKNAIRKEIIQKRKQLTPRDLEETSMKLPARIIPWIRRQIPSAPDSSRPFTVMSYMSYQNEFPTHLLNQSILEEGWRLVLPYTAPDFSIRACVVSSLSSLQTSSMGILEPDPEASEQISASDADLILLPGVAFDRHGMRLGYGKGCYDRFLGASAPDLPPTAALAWSFQIVESVPADIHDRPADWIITEKNILTAER